MTLFIRQLNVFNLTRVNLDCCEGFYKVGERGKSVRSLVTMELFGGLRVHLGHLIKVTMELFRVPLSNLIKCRFLSNEKFREDSKKFERTFIHLAKIVLPALIDKILKK